MTKALQKFQPEPAASKTIEQFQKELEHIEKGLFMQGLGTGLRMKAFWNISRHELYRADGHKNMKAFVESVGYSYRRVTQMLQEGDTLAALVFGAEVPEEKRWLTTAHIDQYVTAKRNAKLLTKHDTLRLPDTDDAVKRITAGDAESQLELNQLTEAFVALPSNSAAGRMLEDGKKPDEKSAHLDILLETVENLSKQTFVLASKGGWGRAAKKRAQALYYARLAFYMLTNDKANLAYVSFEDAQMYLQEGVTCPAHVGFALGIGDE